MAGLLAVTEGKVATRAKFLTSRAMWSVSVLTPVIPATREAEIRRSTVQSRPLRDPILKTPITTKKRAGECPKV
jgi:hypothetical protein